VRKRRTNIINKGEEFWKGLRLGLKSRNAKRPQTSFEFCVYKIDFLFVSNCLILVVKKKELSLIYLSIHVLVAIVNGFKSATSLDDNDTEHALGRDIHDCVQARFHGGGDHSLTFSNNPDNGVKGP